MVDYVKIEDEEIKEEKLQKKKKKMKFSFKKFLFILLGFFILSSIISTISYNVAPKIAVVPITGTIMTSSESSLFSSGGTNSREIANRLYSLRDDTSVKAVILDINSPGGSAVASEEVSRAIESVREIKPVYALISDTGASGAFWIAVSADKVYASSMSILGSIGVTSAGLSFENFIEQYNITYRRQTAGEFKDMGSIFREPSQEEEILLQNLLDEIHLNFINHVANSRNLSFDEVMSFSTGEIFLGNRALELGLIDKIGYFPDVRGDLEEIVGENVILMEFTSSPTLIEMLGIKGIFSSSSIDNQILLK